jgi:hypothetical protein
MARPQFTLGALFLAATYCAVSFGYLRALLRSSETEPLVLAGLWIGGTACLGAGVGATFKRTFVGAAVGFALGLTGSCTVMWIVLEMTHG